jgi:hypothetical protein
VKGEVNGNYSCKPKEECSIVDKTVEWTVKVSKKKGRSSSRTAGPARVTGASSVRMSVPYSYLKGGAKVTVSVKVTITCSDGTKCSGVDSRQFSVGAVKKQLSGR